MPKIVTENISKMKKAMPYLVPRELTDSMATATKFSNINVDRNQSQTRLARSFPLDRVSIWSMRFLVKVGRIIPKIPPPTWLIIGTTRTG